MDALTLLEKQIEQDRIEIEIKEKILGEFKRMAHEAELLKIKSFTKRIKEIIKQFGCQEFTIKHVAHVYKKRYLVQHSDYASLKIKISSVLFRLKTNGFIIVVKQNYGRASNTFKMATN